MSSDIQQTNEQAVAAIVEQLDGLHTSNVLHSFVPYFNNAARQHWPTISSALKAHKQQIQRLERERDAARVVKFNVNDKVRIKLTEHGKKLWLDEWKRYGIEPPALKVDAEGYTREQLWQVMKTYGSACGMAGPLPFDTNILIELRAATDSLTQSPTQDQDTGEQQ